MSKLQTCDPFIDVMSYRCCIGVWMLDDGHLYIPLCRTLWSHPCKNGSLLTYLFPTVWVSPTGFTVRGFNSVLISMTASCRTMFVPTIYLVVVLCLYIPCLANTSVPSPVSLSSPIVCSVS